MPAKVIWAFFEQGLFYFWRILSLSKENSSFGLFPSYWFCQFELLEEEVDSVKFKSVLWVKLRTGTFAQQGFKCSILSDSSVALRPGWDLWDQIEKMRLHWSVLKFFAPFFQAPANPSLRVFNIFILSHISDHHNSCKIFSALTPKQSSTLGRINLIFKKLLQRSWRTFFYFSTDDKFLVPEY